jgi:tetratricopeptide (TPR) repeat protein
MSIRKISLIISTSFILCSYLPARNAPTTFNFSAHSLAGDVSAIDAYNKGEVLAKKGDFTNALPFYEAAVKIDPKFLPAWNRMGFCFYRTDQPDLALEAYTKTLEIDPKDITLLLNIPMVYESQKKYDAEIAAYQHIIDIYPSDPDTYYAQGKVYTYYKIDFENGLTDMCKAYNLYITMNSPHVPEAQKIIDYIYEKMKDNGREDVFFKILTDNKYIVK